MKFQPNSVLLPSYIGEILRRLEEEGYEAWCVGGCVRDSLLGRQPSDWDITTAATPLEIKTCFPEYSTTDIGFCHGTVTLIFPDGPVEITTFRTESGYSDSRHPDKVQFSKNLQEDLSRRDFTVNAMAFSPVRGFSDPFCGREDLENKLIRCVGNPEKRFTEDTLRILRCIRFSAVLGFSVEDGTAQAALKERARLSLLSKERILAEIKKLLCGLNATHVLREFQEILFEVFPELVPMTVCSQHNPYHCFDVWEHSLRVLEAVPPEFLLRMSALLHDCGKPYCKSVDEKGIDHFYRHSQASEAIAAQVLKRLCCSAGETREICQLIRFHNQELPFTSQRIKKLLNRLGAERFFSLLCLMRADLKGQPPVLWEERFSLLTQAEAMAKEILIQKECFSLKDLAINGDDLLLLGFPENRSLGKALENLLNDVLEDKCLNERQALLSQAKIYLASIKEVEQHE